MNSIAILKRKSRSLQRWVVAGSLASFGSVVAVGSASAALDLTPITTAIAGAINDITAAGMVLVSAYASVWVIKELVILFRK